jgi:hypothetical protein
MGHYPKFLKKRKKRVYILCTRQNFMLHSVKSCKSLSLLPHAVEVWLLVLYHGSGWLESSASCLGHVLPLGKQHQVPTGEEAGWASELV